MFHRLSQSHTPFVGLDVHKNSITSAVLEPGSDTALIDRFIPDDASIRRFVGALGDPASLAACYEARSYRIRPGPVPRTDGDRL